MNQTNQVNIMDTQINICPIGPIQTNIYLYICDIRPHESDKSDKPNRPIRDSPDSYFTEIQFILIAYGSGVSRTQGPYSQTILRKNS